MPTVSIVVPTRERADYLDVALASIAPQAREADAEVLVVVDGADPASGAIAERHGARWTGHDAPRGLNAARNTGAAATEGGLVVFVDDDVEAPPGWLGALLEGRRRHRDALVLGGPIEVRLEGFGLPLCGREPPPITALDEGPTDRDVDVVWGANMGIDRRAFELAGTFDPGVPYGFDEDMWERRLRERGGRVVYVAGAGLVHRRDPRDSRLGALMRAAYRRGRALRAYSVHRGRAPSLARELRWLAGCFAHTFRYRCANGLLLTAHSAGRIAALLRGARG